MNGFRKAQLIGALEQMTTGMQKMCEIMLVEAEKDGLVYAIHGDQLPTPPGVVTDVYKVRWMCHDGYARTFDEMRTTVDEISRIIATEEAQQQNDLMRRAGQEKED